MRSEIRIKYETHNEYVGVRSTELTCPAQFMFQTHFVGLGTYNLGFICPEWYRILCDQ